MNTFDQDQKIQQPSSPLKPFYINQQPNNRLIIMQDQQHKVFKQQGSIIPVSKELLINSKNFKSEQSIIESIPYLYFQTQTPFSNQCLKHAINNLFACRVFQSKQMVGLCEQLSGDVINPHKHILGGDYDANVLMLAMQKIGRTIFWFDRRKQFKFTQQQKTKVQGYLVNIKRQSGIFKKFIGLSGRHWISIKWIHDKYFVQYDSKKKHPQIICDIKDAVALINGYIHNQGELFKVYKNKQQLEKIKLIQNQAEIKNAQEIKGFK